MSLGRTPDLKTADLYTGDIIIFQPRMDDTNAMVDGPQEEIPCVDVKQMADNIANRMPLRIVMHEMNDLWAIDGVTATAEVWASAATRPSPKEPAEDGEDNSASEALATWKGKAHDFVFDLRQGVAHCMSRVALHFLGENGDPNRL